jgi:hypothetical protein
MGRKKEEKWKFSKRRTGCLTIVRDLEISDFFQIN